MRQEGKEWGEEGGKEPDGFMNPITGRDGMSALQKRIWPV